MEQLRARPVRGPFATLVLALAVFTVLRRLREGERVRLGACSAVGTVAVVTRQQGDRLTPVIAWSLAFLAGDTALLLWRRVASYARTRL